MKSLKANVAIAAAGCTSKDRASLEQLVTIELFGRPYTFRTSSEGIQAQEVANFLANEVAKIQSQQIGSVSEMNKLTVMILAALNIASTHFEFRASQSEMKQALALRSEDVIRLLDERLAHWQRWTAIP